MATPPGDLILGRSSCVLYLPLTETSGNFTDLKNSAVGTPGAGITRANIDSPVLGSKAPTFSGAANGEIVVPDSAALDVGDNWTSEGWIYVPTLGPGSGYAMVWSKNANAPQFAIKWGASQFQFAMNVDSQGGDLVLSAAKTATGWYHVGMGKNGSTRLLTVNGAVDQTNGTNVASSNNAFNLEIGSNQNVNSFLPSGAAVSHLAIYNTLLTAADMLDSYEAGRNHFIPTRPSGHRGSRQMAQLLAT